MSISKKAEKKQRVKKAPKERKAKGRKSEQDVKAKITEPSAEAVLQDDGATAGAITVKFERAEIEKALTVACDFIEKKSTMPILAHIYLGITDAGCRIIGTNLDRYWIKVINCKPSGPISVSVPAVLLTEIKALPSDITLAELTFNENTVSVNSRCQMATLPGTDFPAIPEEGKTVKAEITGLIEKSRRVLPATGDSDTRYTLNAVCINLSKGHIVATDGHRLHIDDIEAYMDSPQLLVPNSVIALAVKHKASETVKYNAQHIYFEVAGGAMISRLVEGTYPNYEQVIPEKNPIRTKFSGREMLKIMEGAIPMTREKTRAVRLTINGQIKIEAMNPELGSYSWSVACETKGNKESDIIVGVNAQYLVEAIKAYTSKEDDSVIMALDEPLSPILINNKAVVMPMRV